MLVIFSFCDYFTSHCHHTHCTFFPVLTDFIIYLFISLILDIEMDFKEQLKKLVPSLLAPENLVVKQIHGNKITGKELVEYFKVTFVMGAFHSPY